MKPVEALQFIAALPRLPKVERGAPAVELIPGVLWWKNKNNPFHVLQLYYYSDPEKDPNREGKDWFDKKTDDMGGVQSSRWQKEYEIDFKAQAGAKVFHHFDKRHITPPQVHPDFYHRWLVWDYGLRNPTACLVIATSEEGHHEVEYEYYARDRSVRETSYLVHKDLFELYAPARLAALEFNDDELQIINRDQDTNPEAPSGMDLITAWESELFEGVIGDPAMGERREKDSKTVLERFAEFGWYIGKGNRATNGLVQVDTWFQYDLLTIQRQCVNTIREVTYLVWADHLDPTLNYREREVDKNNHTTDILKIFANQFPIDADRPVPKNQYDAHHHDLEVREALEQARWQDLGGAVHPTLGGGW